MNLVKPSFTELEYENPLLLGERCARVCYRSEGLIKEGSAFKLISGLISAGHTAMLEHIPVYIKIHNGMYLVNENLTTHPLLALYTRKFSKYVKINHTLENDFISTNLRVLYDIKSSLAIEFLSHEGDKFYFDETENTCYSCNYSDYPEYFSKRITILFTMDRIGSQSFCRHRVFSFAQESTRWCNYLKEKFGAELNIIEPCWLKDFDKEEFIHDMQEIEKYYFKWINKGYKAEEARAFLPFGLKTEIVMTGFADAWKHFFRLRVDSHAHSQARELAIPLEKYFKQKEYII